MIQQHGSQDARAASPSLDVENAVLARYSQASKATEPSLCCPVEYDSRFLDVLPRELIDRDYGCGDPSRFVGRGETVLDLGSGGGKVCYIASQVVGAEGQVIGVDMNDDMLSLARKFQDEIGQRIGYRNVQFRKGRIQNLALDLERFEEHLQQQPVQGANDWLRAQSFADQLRREQPMIESGSIDVIISNCVFNLVNPTARRQMFDEMFRVLRHGGRVVVSDIVSDEPVPQQLKNDPTLWSGCISGAFVEPELLETFAHAGFYGMEILDRPVEPWATIEGIEFRGVTVRAFKGKEGPCMDHHQAVIYKGPWKSVVDDDGHTLRRGEPMAVCAKTLTIYSRPPYSGDIVPVSPRTEVADGDAKPFDCRLNSVRDPRKLKGERYRLTELPQSGCGGNDSCC